MTFGSAIQFAATPNLLHLFNVLNLILIKFNIRSFKKDWKKFHKKHLELVATS